MPIVKRDSLLDYGSFCIETSISDIVPSKMRSVFTEKREGLLVIRDLLSILAFYISSINELFTEYCFSLGVYWWDTPFSIIGCKTFSYLLR